MWLLESLTSVLVECLRSKVDDKTCQVCDCVLHIVVYSAIKLPAPGVQLHHKPIYVSVCVCVCGCLWNLTHHFYRTRRRQTHKSNTTDFHPLGLSLTHTHIHLTHTRTPSVCPTNKPVISPNIRRTLKVSTYAIYWTCLTSSWCQNFASYNNKHSYHINIHQQMALWCFSQFWS